jgi:cell division inhibitor SepF
MHRMGVYLGLVEDDEYADDTYGASGASPNGHERGTDRGTDRGHERSHDRSPARREAYMDSDYPREKRYPEIAHRGERVERRYAGDAYAESQDFTDGYVEDYPQPGYQITALHPRTYNEARTIGEQFRKSTPVIMNLSDMDDADAKRLVDFAAGLTFGLHGRIERVTAKVFLLSPHHVSVTAQDKARIESGFFNQS